MARTRKKPWTASELQNNPHIVRDNEGYKGKWSQAYFGNNNPLHLEIGCGKGRFIIHTAQRNPQTNYIALERAYAVLAQAARKSGDVTNNLAFILGDADNLESIFEIGEISEIYLFFSDPWPNKKKWAKRRLTHHRYLEVYKKLLCEKTSDRQPAINFRTDNEPLYTFTLEQAQIAGFTIETGTEPPGDIVTEYEEKFTKQGLPIYSARLTP